MSRILSPRILILGGIVLALILLGMSIRVETLLDLVSSREQWLREQYQKQPFLVGIVAFAIYVTVTALSLPGAAIMTLLFGWFFGLITGLVIVSVASTLGATLAFLISRQFLRNWVETKFGDKLRGIQESFRREGAFYLFTLRLIPAFPFFVVNLLMGLTAISPVTFWWVSQLGMLPGTAVYVYAGATIPDLDQIRYPSRFRVEDLLDPKELLVEHLPSNKKAPIWNSLSSKTRELIENSRDRFEREDLQIVVQELNESIADPDWHRDLDWSGEAQTLIEGWERGDKAQTIAFHRKLLVASYPDKIGAPRPILSFQLLLAFAALGLFPILVRRILMFLNKVPSNP